MHVLIAPDKFRGTLSASEAAEAMARGWRRADPPAEIRQLPVADGGDGTLDVLVDALGGRTETARVRGPLGDPVEAAFGLIPTRPGTAAVVEMARASGLALVPAARRDALRSGTHGTGELIKLALERSPTKIVVCIGGSATTDGGAGVAQALGVRLLTASGEEVPPGGAGLRDLARIDVTGLDARVRAADVVVASDVDNPLTGPAGAAATYGPQKGADPGEVRLLDEALAHAAAVIHRDLGIDIRDLPGAGAAGGLGGGLVAFLGARLRPGFEVVAEALGLPQAMELADVAVTGEGRYDAQSERGKAPAGVLRLAREARCRSVLIAGDVPQDVRPDADVVESLAAWASPDEAMHNAAALVEDAAARAASTIMGSA